MRSAGDEDSMGTEGDEGNEGNEGDEDDEGEEGDEGDEGNEGNEGSYVPPSDGTPPSSGTSGANTISRALGDGSPRAPQHTCGRAVPSPFPAPACAVACVLIFRSLCRAGEQPHALPLTRRAKVAWRRVAGPPPPPPPTSSCGATVLSNNFDQYPGAYQSYTRELFSADFPRDAGRPGADGVDRQPGHNRYSNEGGLRADAGEGMLRITHPEGADRLTAVLMLLHCYAFC